MVFLEYTLKGGIPVVLHEILSKLNMEACFQTNLEIVFMALLPTPVLFELLSVLIINISFSSIFSLRLDLPGHALLE